MSILVAYASKYGATRGIAERIADTLRPAGRDAEARPVTAVDDLAGYEAFVIGSPAYYGSWLKEAAAFVRRNRAVLAARPVWLFSSGPLGTGEQDAQGRDLREVSLPKEIAEFRAASGPRGHRVFFGALDLAKLDFTDRMIATLPVAHVHLPEGDFRDWPDIEAWAGSIARALAAPQPVAP
jgi:menaquinone-dependent protoporphyrinogen oxidase